MAQRDDPPPTAEGTERANRQPGAKGLPRERGPAPESADEQPEERLNPEHRRRPSGQLGEEHRPGARERPERKP